MGPSCTICSSSISLVLGQGRFTYLADAMLNMVAKDNDSGASRITASLGLKQVSIGCHQVDSIVAPTEEEQLETDKICLLEVHASFLERRAETRAHPSSADPMQPCSRTAYRMLGLKILPAVSMPICYQPKLGRNWAMRACAARARLG